MSDLDKNGLSSASARAERGRQSFQSGHAFEDKVAELYRLLKFTVQHGGIFSGRQVDLFLSGRWGDLPVHRAIECKVGEVTTRDIDDFLIKLRLVRREVPTASGTIVSGVTDAVAAHAVAEGVTLVLYRDLASMLIDGHRYVTGLLRELEENPSYHLDSFVQPRIGQAIEGPDRPAFEAINEWMSDGESRQLTLLGDLGTGKSFLARVISYRLAKDFLAAPHEKPLPVLVDLRDADREVSREGILVTHFSRHGLDGVSFKLFQHALSEGNIVLILDGFDEMASRVTRSVTVRNFDELMRCVQGRAKVLLTCRTHYFRDRTEEEELLLGRSHADKPEPARDLYWDLIGRPGFNIEYLRPFGAVEINNYVKRVRPTDSQEVLGMISKTYDLMGLSTRPLLLDMIVKTVDKLKSPKINAATIYSVFTDIWIERDQWRGVLSTEEKLIFLTTIALRFWTTGRLSFHYSDLSEHVHENFARKLKEPRELVEVDHEVRTASFLTRDSEGHYGFAHKSYAEFFLARHIAEQLRTNNLSALEGRRLTPEIISFIRDLVEDSDVDMNLEAVLCGTYWQHLSENSLLILYALRLSQARRESSHTRVPEVYLPSEINLPGAKLDQVNLERCVMYYANLKGADLSQANLFGADFTSADFTGARLDQADIREARFSNAHMAGASLVGATAQYLNISGANLENANLSYVDLTTADAVDANFEDATVSDALLSDELAGLLGGRNEAERVTSRTRQMYVDAGSGVWSTIQESLPDIVASIRRYSLLVDENVEDLAGEVMVRLVEACLTRNLDATDKPRLMAYANQIARDRVRDANRTDRRSISISEVVQEEPLDEDSELNTEILETFLLRADMPEGNPDPEHQLYWKQLMEQVKKKLTEPHWSILQAIAAGYSPSEISSKHAVPIGSIRRALTRIRSVVRVVLENS
jgi:RNA polymerase sigma factor (sigma-70 family)